jgi:hypothetical protein
MSSALNEMSDDVEEVKEVQVIEEPVKEEITKEEMLKCMDEEYELRMRDVWTEETCRRREELLRKRNETGWKEEWGAPPRPRLVRSSTVLYGSHAFSKSLGAVSMSEYESVRKKGKK